MTGYSPWPAPGMPRSRNPLNITAVGWDLDSSLANTRHRQHMVPRVKAGELTWDDYSLACSDDPVLPASAALMRILEVQHLQFAASGRSGVATSQTWDWLKRNDLPVSRLDLRPSGDTTENGEFKVQRIRQWQSDGVNVILFIEDWPPAARYIQEHTGVPTLCVNPMYEGVCTCGYQAAQDAGAVSLSTEGGI